MGKMCLFSAVKDVMLEHGRPVAGATIERSYKWAWKDQSGSDRSTTDAQGAFSLPVIWGRSLLGSLLPHEPFVIQTILINHGGKRYEAWLSDKRGYEENDELDGRRSTVTGVSLTVSLIRWVPDLPCHAIATAASCAPSFLR